MRVKFFVEGKSAPAGSHKAFVRLNRKNGRHRAVVRPACDSLERWQAVVKQEAIKAMRGEPATRLPVKLTTVFYIARPDSHYGQGPLAATLQKKAPKHHTYKPDLSKLIRGLEDGLTKVVYMDDSQVMIHDAVKRWHEKDFVSVTVETIDD